MRYMGGKARIAKRLADVILASTDRRGTLIEPFMGGGNMTAALAPHFAHVDASDLNPDVTVLWQAMTDGWQPPMALSREEHAALKAWPVPMPLRSFAGFGRSFSGFWFASHIRDDYPGNVIESDRRALLRKAAALHAGVTIATRSYIDAPVTPDSVVYCDPPYRGTTGYATGAFDHDLFWAVAGMWSLMGARVLVSGYAAPPEWTPIWERKVTIRGRMVLRDVTERLFTFSDRDLILAPVRATLSGVANWAGSGSEAKVSARVLPDERHDPL